MRILAYLTKKAHMAMWDNMLSIVKALRDMGHSVASCDVNDSSSREALVEFLEHPDHFDMSIGFNSMGLEWYVNEDSAPMFPYENVDVPHVSIVLDEPFNKFASGYDLPCKNHLVTYLDRSDHRILDILYPGKNMKKLFLPLGGTTRHEQVEMVFASKEYDVVVSASNWKVGSMRPGWHEEGIDRGIVHVLDDVAEVMQTRPVSMIAAFEQVLKERGMYDAEYLEAMTPYFWPVLRYVKPWRRQQMVRCLAELGRRVDIFGEGWEDVPFTEGMRKHGKVSYKEMIDVISKSKVLVQDEALFNDGAHDRVFTGMLNGAVVVSEYSAYLDEIFEDRQEIFLFDWQHTVEQMGIIDRLLADEPYRLSIAARAYGNAKENHTWQNRVERIMEAVGIFWNGQNPA